MRMNIFGFQMAVKNFLKGNTINFLKYALILRRSVYTGCPKVAKKLHNLFVIKDANFFFFIDDSYASTSYSENIAVYI
jgi:hypothetical protein